VQLSRILAHRDQWAAKVIGRTVGVNPVASSGIDRTVIGLAIEYAIGLDLAEDAYASRRALLPRATAAWIATAIDSLRTGEQAGGRQQPGPARDLLCSAFHLARWHDQLYHGTELQTPPEGVQDFLSKHSGHPLDDPQWLLAEPELSELWSRYVDNARGVLTSWQPVVAAPVLLRREGIYGWHPAFVADFITADALTEVKAGIVDEQGWASGEVAVQLMRYALLAPGCGYSVNTVALYLARYGLLLTWDVAGLMTQLAGESLDVQALGDQLRHS
jgi:hypothetical protein